jgi:NAD-dependent SIR2 family protein deacetylase
MGKNPNAKKLKEKKHRERTYSNNIDDLEEEAARQGITVLELQK